MSAANKISRNLH